MAILSRIGAAILDLTLQIAVKSCVLFIHCGDPHVYKSLFSPRPPRPPLAVPFLLHPFSILGFYSAVTISIALCFSDT